MAIFECNLFSRVLFQSVRVRVILPTPNSNAYFFGEKTRYPEANEKYQTLYLLHGFTADYSDWHRNSRIEDYVQDKHLAVVMASANNSCYCDLAGGGQYYKFFSEELPQLVRAIFPLSSKREHNFIAGLSMGGAGTMKIALLNPQNYAAAASLSGGIGERPREKFDFNNPGPASKAFHGAYGANLEYYDENEQDVQTMLENAVRKGVELPRLYVCCGTEDGAFRNYTLLEQKAAQLGLDITFEKGPGVHNFDFWDPYIKRIINWLPLVDGYVD